MARKRDLAVGLRYLIVPAFQLQRFMELDSHPDLYISDVKLSDDGQFVVVRLTNVVLREMGITPETHYIPRREKVKVIVDFDPGVGTPYTP